MVMGSDGLGGVHFTNAELTQVIGYAALVVILAEGGLGTKWKEIKPVLPAATVLAVLGVAVSVGVTAAGAHYLIGLEWRQALIIGAVVSSTDAAAVFSVLRKIPLPARVTGTLEAESGFNDAPVVILVVAFSTAGPVEHWYVLVGEIVLELAIGAAIGLTVGWLGSWALRHVALPASGLYPIAVMSIAVAAYALGALAHGSGFLAVYLAAMVLGNAKLPHWPATRGFAEGLGWIAQIGMFVLLGLLVTPHELVDDIWPALVIGLVLTVIARPLGVVASLLPFRVPCREAWRSAPTPACTATSGPWRAPVWRRSRARTRQGGEPARARSWPPRSSSSRDRPAGSPSWPTPNCSRPRRGTGSVPRSSAVRWPSPGWPYRRPRSTGWACTARTSRRCAGPWPASTSRRPMSSRTGSAWTDCPVRAWRCGRETRSRPVWRPRRCWPRRSGTG